MHSTIESSLVTGTLIGLGLAALLSPAIILLQFWRRRRGAPLVTALPYLLRALVLLLGIILVCAATSGLLVAWEWRADYKASDTWPTVRGRVTIWNIIERADTATRLGDLKYEMDFEYTYEVEGRLYANKDLYFSLESMLDQRHTYDSTSALRTEFNPYPVDRAVVVYYDPDDPQNSVLELRFDRGENSIVLGGSGLALLIGLVMYGFALAELLAGPRVRY